MTVELPAGASQPLDYWLAAVDASNVKFQREAGATKLGLFKAAAQVLAAPRILRKRLNGRPDHGIDSPLQRP